MMAESDKGKSFAEKQLAKFGWKKGMGLGRLNDGIAEPLRVKVRADKSGIGHDTREDFSHWWDNAYNKAVNKLSVVTSVDGNVEVKSSKDSSISAFKPVFKSSLLYDNFDQKGTLTGASYKPNISNTESESEDETPVAVSTSGNGLLLDMSDDQLFKLCGGATAHKGARHGIRMTAKMKRLEAMAKNDALLVADWKRKEEEHQAAKTPITKLATMPTKLWKNRTISIKSVIGYKYEECTAANEDGEISNSCTQSESVENLNHEKKRKKKTKRDKRSEPEEGVLEEEDEEANELSQSTKRQRHENKRRNDATLLERTVDLDCDQPKKKKKKRNENVNEENLICSSDANFGENMRDKSQKGDEDASPSNGINCSLATPNSLIVENSSSKTKSKKKKKRTESET